MEITIEWVMDYPKPDIQFIQTLHFLRWSLSLIKPNYLKNFYNLCIIIIWVIISFVQVLEWPLSTTHLCRLYRTVWNLKDTDMFFLHYLLHWSALQSNEVVLFRNHLPLFGEKYFMTEQMLQSKSLYMSHSVSNLYFLIHL